MKPWAEEFYKSLAWQKCRRAYRAKRFGICERCGKPAKIVHHKIYLNQKNISDPSVSLNFDNLELLCHECHNLEHFRQTSFLRNGLRLTADGQLVQVSDEANNGIT
jgi:5-methylcytosine-specific restriction endonuclease McrA